MVAYLKATFVLKERLFAYFSAGKFFFSVFLSKRVGILGFLFERFQGIRSFQAPKVGFLTLCLFIVDF